MCIMVMGIGIIGALASIMASVLVGGGADDGAAEPSPETPGVTQELAALRSELAALRQLLEAQGGQLGPASPTGETRNGTGGGGS
jgi:hypothetical protein